VLRELVFAPVAEKLAEVERRIQARISSRADLISEVTTYALGSGGKRVRPALLLLCARMCGYDGGERDVDLAVVAEFMHVATLIHDDIIDNAQKRRGRPSAHARWGPHVSVLAGDFLYSHSIQRLVRDGAFRVLAAFADATVAVDLDPLSLLCRLCAAVPPPRFHTVRYAGVLGPPSRWRALVVASAPEHGPPAIAANRMAPSRPLRRPNRPRTARAGGLGRSS
jgi:octaprenyl-diphosphate synthase